MNVLHSHQQQQQQHYGRHHQIPSTQDSGALLEGEFDSQNRAIWLPTCMWALLAVTLLAVLGFGIATVVLSAKTAEKVGAAAASASAPVLPSGPAPACPAPAPVPPAPRPSAASTLAGACGLIPPAGQRINVDNLIQGAGVAGLYTAYRLVKNFGANPRATVIIDAANRFGGRVNDYCLDGDPQLPPSPSNPLQFCHGGGPLRLNDAHALGRGLANELGVELEWGMRPYIYHTDRDGEVSSIRPGTDRLGYPAYVSDPELPAPDYPNGICQHQPGDGNDVNWSDYAPIPVNGSRLDGFAALFWFVRAGQGDFSALTGNFGICPPNFTIDPRNYPDYGSYSRALVGESVDQYMRSWLRFRSLTSSDHDADHIVDWTRNELIVDGDGDFYPVGGWSAIVRGMVAYLQNAGVQFQLGDPVVCMNKGTTATGGLPTVATQSGKFYVAKKIFNSIPPMNMTGYIQGTIMDSLNQSPVFNSVESEKVVTMSIWWKRRWWEDIRPENAWLNKIYFTTYFGGECFNTFEIYTTPYLYKQNVTRGIYDDGQCVEMWEALIREGPTGTEKMKQLVVDGVNRHLVRSGFPNVQVSVNDIAFARPLLRWPAWHLARPDTPHGICDTEDWAVQPLSDTPLHMVGEAYGAINMGWCEAAWKTALRAIKRAYPSAATTATVNQLLAVKVCQSNEYVTWSNNLADIHSPHTRIPLATADAAFFAAGYTGAWTHWRPRCADPAIDGNSVDYGQWYNYYPSSCGKLTTSDPCHHTDLYTSWVPDYGTFAYGNSWAPYGADPNPGCAPVVPASVASVGGRFNGDPPAHGGGL